MNRVIFGKFFQHITIDNYQYVSSIFARTTKINISREVNEENMVIRNISSEFLEDGSLNVSYNACATHNIFFTLFSQK